MKLSHQIRCRELQAFFQHINDRDYGVSPGVSNGKYLIQQATDYTATWQQAELADDADGASKGAYRAFARSELSRILAIAARECLRNNWSFEELLEEGIEYEEDVRKDIEEGRRPAKSHKGLASL